MESKKNKEFQCELNKTLPFPFFFVPVSPNNLVIHLNEYDPWLGSKSWRFKKEGAKDPYQQEHDDLFDAIRNNKPYNEAENGAKSSMTAILGRMVTYSGKVIDWTDAINSEISYFPEHLAWDANPKSMPRPGFSLAPVVAFFQFETAGGTRPARLDDVSP